MSIDVAGFAPRRAARALVAAAAGALALAAPAHAAGPVTRSGAWIVDDQGRAVIGHGVNVLRKTAPFYPSRFGDADAALLADEGFTLARIGFIWEAVEPTPGHYDDAYIARVAALDDLLARHGIRTLVDFHQDLWSRADGGDGAPAWATQGSTFNDAFAAFWRDTGGIQTHFVDAWRHVAAALRGHDNILGFDPFNEPYPGSDYACSPFTPCPEFESGPLAAFYKRVTAAIRSAGARQVIWPEGVAQNGVERPALPHFDDPQTAFTWHFYCSFTQTSSDDVAVDQPSTAAQACAPVEDHGIGSFVDYAHDQGVPSLLGEFSCNDVNPDNAQVVDRADRAFASWTIWAYYTAADDPADCSHQGLLRDDAAPASEANAKQDKLDALVVPYPQAVAGEPRSYAYDRATRTMTLAYATTGASAPTQVFVPARVYPHGYAAAVRGGRVVSGPTSPWLLIAADPGAASVSVTVTPRTDGTTLRPSQVPGGGRAPCASRRVVRIHLRRAASRVTVSVDGRRVAVLRGRRRVVKVALTGLPRGTHRVRLVAHTRRGRTLVVRRAYRTCA
jgi:endoglycosylceramidase